MKGAIVRIAPERCVDQPRRWAWRLRHDREVFLPYATAARGALHRGVHRRVERDDHDARGVLVQPGENSRPRVGTVAQATAARPIPIYLYHFPAQSGLPWRVELVRRLLELFGPRIVGLKDSSGDMAYAREAARVAPGFKVFPSTEAALMEARTGVFAGCISATANVNADLCAHAWRDGDAGALDAAVSIRGLFDGKQLVSGVKALLAHIHHDPAWGRVQPPLSPFAATDRAAVIVSISSGRLSVAACTTGMKPAAPIIRLASAELACRGSARSGRVRHRE